MSIPHHSHSDLENIATSFLQRWAKDKYDGCSLQIEYVIEGFGYYIWSVPGLQLLAEAYLAANSNNIYIDEDQYQNAVSFRCKFTLAEELAHVLIHAPSFKGKTLVEIKAIQNSISDEEYLRIEREAKYLAGALLMRKDKFCLRFQHHERRMAGRKLNPSRATKQIMRELSMDFNVSCYAVSLRALNLALIDQPQLDELLESF